MTPEAKTALVHCAQALKNRQNWRWDCDKSLYLAIIASKFLPFAVLFQWFVNDKDALHVLEWLFLPHTVTESMWTVKEVFSYLVRKSRERLQTLNGQDPHTIYIPASKDNLAW